MSIPTSSGVSTNMDGNTHMDVDLSYHVDLPSDANKMSVAALAQVTMDYEDETESGVSPIHGDTNSGNGEPSHVIDLHEGVQCNECFNNIIGFRYICMQCADWDLCGACEARAAHADHLVLRVPKPQTYAKTMIDTIHSSIRTFLQVKEDENKSFVIKVKQEADSDDDNDEKDDDNDDDGQVDPEPESNMYPEAKTQRAMLKLNKEQQILVNVQNTELVLDPLRSSEEKAVPTTHLGQDKPKIKLEKDDISFSESHQLQNASITLKEEPIPIKYEPRTDAGQNEDNLTSDQIYDKANTKRKKYC